MERLEFESKEAAKLLATSYALGSLNYVAHWVPKSPKFRVGTLSVESAISDICQCIINSTEKRDKRIKRIRLIMQVYQSMGYEFTSEILEMVSEVESLPVENVTSDASDAELIATLTSELNHEDGFKNGKLFFTINGQWAPPLAKAFHGHCTKQINKDGDVYDIMTKVGTITLAKLVASHATSPCEQELLACAQLIFKGGAALGKFLFQNQTWWGRLTPDQQKEIQSSFILGGDNDTSIYFANVKEITKRYGLGHVSETIAQIAEKTDNILSVVCEEYNLRQLLSLHSKSMQTESMFTFAGQEFNFQLRQASGFRLTKEDAVTMCLTPHQRPQSQVFTTQSRVEFTVGEQTVKFELVRAKLGFASHSQGLRLNTYSELLDISLEYPDSAILFKKAFVPVRL
jgi:hypothetical protein